MQRNNQKKISAKSRKQTVAVETMDTHERRHWAAILFLTGPPNALRLTEKLRNQDGGAHDFAPLIPPLLYIQASRLQEFERLD